jgi:hypothetical protein
LPRDCCGNIGSAISDVDAVEAGKSIYVTTTFRILDTNSFATSDNRRRNFTEGVSLKICKWVECACAVELCDGLDIDHPASPKLLSSTVHATDTAFHIPDSLPALPFPGEKWRGLLRDPAKSWEETPQRGALPSFVA